jgi:hypothetical protein
MKNTKSLTSTSREQLHEQTNEFVTLLNKRIKQYYAKHNANLASKKDLY